MSTPNPQLVGWIKQASKLTGADPAALLATALRESGGQLNGRPGDNNTSFGPFQFHIGGALGSHSPAWASTYPAILNRAQEFAKNQVHGGVGAAAVQRPADRASYAAAVEGELARARQILGTSAPASAPARAGLGVSPSAGTTTARTPIQQALAILDAGTPGGALAQFRLGLGSKPSPITPAAPAGAPAAGKPGYVLPNPSGHKVIGVPYHGTHTLGNWESDNAIDIATPIGTPIYAAADGTIGSQIGSLGSSSSRFAGLRVHLQTQGNELYYAHLSRLTVKAGQHVKAGQVIGYSGEANGVAHLHLGSKNGSPMVYA